MNIFELYSSEVRDDEYILHALEIVGQR